MRLDGSVESAAEINRDLWTHINREHTDVDARRAWQQPGVRWGLFAISDDELQVLGDVRDLDIAEFGCGTAFLSAALARAGARPIGIDVTHAQLLTAQRCQQEFNVWFPLIEANAETVPLASRSLDIVVSEYGASLWCDPELWVAEAARLLRDDGRLVFLTNSVLSALCVPAESGVATEQLQRPQRDLGRVQWPGGGVEHHSSHGRWIDILTRNGFTVERLNELYAPPTAVAPDYYEIVSTHWAQRWPAEDLWTARLRLRT